MFKTKDLKMEIASTFSTTIPTPIFLSVKMNVRTTSSKVLLMLKTKDKEAKDKSFFHNPHFIALASLSVNLSIDTKERISNIMTFIRMQTSKEYSILKKCEVLKKAFYDYTKKLVYVKTKENIGETKTMSTRNILVYAVVLMILASPLAFATSSTSTATAGASDGGTATASSGAIATDGADATAVSDAQADDTGADANANSLAIADDNSESNAVSEADADDNGAPSTTNADANSVAISDDNAEADSASSATATDGGDATAGANSFADDTGALAGAISSAQADDRGNANAQTGANADSDGHGATNALSVANADADGRRTDADAIAGAEADDGADAISTANADANCNLSSGNCANSDTVAYADAASDADDRGATAISNAGADADDRGVASSVARSIADDDHFGPNTVLADSDVNTRADGNGAVSTGFGQAYAESDSSHETIAVVDSDLSADVDVPGLNGDSAVVNGATFAEAHDGATATASTVGDAVARNDAEVAIDEFSSCYADGIDEFASCDIEAVAQANADGPGIDADVDAGAVAIIDTDGANIDFTNAWANTYAQISAFANAIASAVTSG